MKNTPMALALIVLTSCFGNGRAPVQFQVPPGVKAEFKVNPEFYSFTWGTNGEVRSLFMIFPHPAGLSSEMVGPMASQMLTQPEPTLRKMEGVRDMRVTSSDLYAGKYMGKEITAAVTMTNPLIFYQCAYVLWDGQRLWQGQLTGAESQDTERVHQILKSRR